MEKATRRWLGVFRRLKQCFIKNTIYAKIYNSNAFYKGFVMTDAERLKELFRTVGNKTKFAKEHGVPGGASMIWQHLKGLRPISLEAAQAYMHGFDCSLEDISPGLAKKYPSVTNRIEENTPSYMTSVVTVSKSDAVFEWLDIQTLCGVNSVRNNDYQKVISRLVIPAQKAIELMNVSNRDKHIKVVSISNDSMAPTIESEDLLFVDTSVKDFQGEAVYILLHGGGLICKRLQLLGKSLTVTSDNKNYDSWCWDERPAETRIVGKVIRALPLNFKVF